MFGLTVGVAILDLYSKYLGLILPTYIGKRVQIYDSIAYNETSLHRPRVDPNKLDFCILEKKKTQDKLDI